jgi:hypothetical protein
MYSFVINPRKALGIGSCAFGWVIWRSTSKSHGFDRYPPPPYPCQVHRCAIIPPATQAIAQHSSHRRLASRQKESLILITNKVRGKQLIGIAEAEVHWSDRLRHPHPQIHIATTFLHHACRYPPPPYPCQVHRCAIIQSLILITNKVRGKQLIGIAEAEVHWSDRLRHIRLPHPQIHIATTFLHHACRYPPPPYPCQVHRCAIIPPGFEARGSLSNIFGWITTWRGREATMTRVLGDCLSPRTLFVININDSFCRVLFSILFPPHPQIHIATTFFAYLFSRDSRVYIYKIKSS